MPQSNAPRRVGRDLATEQQKYHFSRFHIYVLIHGIRFSLSDLLHSVTASRSIHISADDTILFCFMAE